MLPNIIEEVGAVMGLPESANHSEFHSEIHSEFASDAGQEKTQPAITAHSSSEMSARPVVLRGPVLLPAFAAQLTTRPSTTEADCLSPSDDALAPVWLALSAGNPLFAVDLLVAQLALDGRSAATQRLYLAALAAAGSPGLALAHFDRLMKEGFGAADGVAATGGLEPDWVVLHAGLRASQALLAADLCAAQCGEVAVAYEIAFMRAGGYRSACGSAALWCLAGEADQARIWAVETLRQVRLATPADEREFFEVFVAEAQALLILGELDGCRERLRNADELLRDDVQLRADATRLILRLCQQMGCVEGLSGVLRVPAVAFLERTGGELDHLPPLFDERASATAIGDLTSGAIIHAAVCDPLDVRAVEWLMDTGARVHATIADEMAEFRIHFARRFDEIQAQRMVGVLERCASVTVGRGLLADEFDWRRRQTTSQALGRSIADARRTAGSWHLLRLRQTERGGWIDRGDWIDNVDAQPQTPLSRINLDRLITTPAVQGKRRIVGLLFADFVGFRRLGDDVMQQFWQEMFVAIGELMEPHAARILLGKTWGDGLHIVTTDASTVAAIAVAIQRYIAQRRADAADALAGLEMRIAVHYAPVFCDLDPVSKSSAFLGTQLTFAARIEPVTPPGTIYATEAITAQLALESPNEYLLEYAGRIELAKNFGQHRLYCLTDAARH